MCERLCGYYESKCEKCFRIHPDKAALSAVKAECSLPVETHMPQK